MERARRRASIILELVRKCGNIRKTQVQKFIYFLQEVVGVKLGYRYEMYHYGPFCFELSDDLDAMGAMGILDIEEASSGYGFNISEGAYAKEPDEEDAKVLRQYEKALDGIVETFGKLRAEQLEIISTVHFVDSILKRKSKRHDKKTVIEQVKRLKPKFTPDDIGKVYDILDEAEWLYRLES